MLRIDRRTRSLERLEQRSLPDAGIRERGDLQSMIRSSPDPFFAELGERLLLIGEEIRPAEFVDDRVDLLALDPSGAAVVVEMKRGSHKLHLLQALAYVAMVAKWDPARFIAERSQLTGCTPEQAEDEIEEFLVGEVASLNQRQRVLLLAEDFDYDVLVAAEWLNERYNVDIRCSRLSLSTDGSSEFLSCTVIFPPPEITQHAAQRGSRRPGRQDRWSDWDEALSQVANPAVIEYFRRQLANGAPGYLDRRVVVVSINGRRWFHVAARRRRAYVWQRGRFRGDIDFWRERLSPDSEITEVAQERRLRFYLSSPQDFKAFEDACTGALIQIVLESSHGANDEDEP